MSQENISRAERESAIVIFDPDEKNSVINMIPDDMVEAIKAIPPIYFNWSESALEKNANLEERDYRLRISFWNVYNNTVELDKTNISIWTVIKGVCKMHYWKTQVLTNPKKLAWIMFPPADYTKFMQECLHLSMKSMREIMALPIKSKDKDGKEKIDHALVNQKIKIWEKVELRVKGAVAQSVNINQKSLNVNLNKNQNSRISSNDMDAIDAELALLEEKETPLLSINTDKNDKEEPIVVETLSPELQEKGDSHG